MYLYYKVYVTDYFLYQMNIKGGEMKVTTHPTLLYSSAKRSFIALYIFSNWIQYIQQAIC